ncbi:MAG TPA: RNB domain-containing ribonuclease, partial [Gemmatimonadaceae bacterium]|nr:RNB domain-containing ribonuclease [Gemmatimonadaceae bacterium]
MPSHVELREAARRAMIEHGFVPDPPRDVLTEVSAAAPAGSSAQDLRALPWSSIDNDSSRDLDQLEVAERLPDGVIRVRVAIADVDAVVRKDSATDRFAGLNATSVYTGVATFPMLPEKLSTDLTSLGQDADRASIIIEFDVAKDGTVPRSTVYVGLVENHAKLAYGNVGAWLDGHGQLPAAATPAIQE